MIKRPRLGRVGSIDRATLACGGVFLVAGLFYLWTAGTTEALSLHDGSGDRYNLLADAFLHFRLSIGHAPAALLHLANPYNPYANAPFTSGVTDAASINDDILYHGRLYFEWGPAPALILLVPLHLLGFEPSASVTVFTYALVGLAFALATLRIVVMRIGRDMPLWMCILAALALSLSSVVPFLLREPTVTTDTLAGGYCFTMAGVWLATSALVRRSASLASLALMSLAFGLAANSRPTLALPALVLVPVYRALRSSRSRRSLVCALGLPFAICILLLLAYNQARFHNPFEVGARYQLSGLESRTAPFGHFSYIWPGLRFYMLTAPIAKILFPFVVLNTPAAATPVGLAVPEATGGLLGMAPIVVFILALPWLSRWRPAPLGALPGALLVLAGAGVAITLLSSYQFYASTERYEVDFATLLVLAGLTGWLALSKRATRLWRRVVQLGGGLLAAWSCFTGLAVTFSRSGKGLAVTRPATWRTLEDAGAPLSTAIAAVIGRPVIAEVSAKNEAATPASYDSLGSSVTEFALSPAEHAAVTIVSPDATRARLGMRISLHSHTGYGMRVDGPGPESHGYPLPPEGGTIDVPVQLHVGLNRIALGLTPSAVDHIAPTTQVMIVRSLTIESSRSARPPGSARPR